MTTAEILTTLRDTLRQYAAAYRGHVSIARDPFHVLELLGETPASFRVIVA